MANSILEDPPIRDEQGSRNWIRWFVKIKFLLDQIGQVVGAALTADRAVQTSSLGIIEASDVSSTELGYVQGVTSAIQNQIDNKVTKVTLSNIIDSSGGTASLTLANIINPLDSPVSADALRDDIVANILPLIRNAIATLANSCNTINSTLK